MSMSLRVSRRVTLSLYSTELLCSRCSVSLIVSRRVTHRLSQLEADVYY